MRYATVEQAGRGPNAPQTTVVLVPSYAGSPHTLHPEPYTLHPKP